MLGDMKGIKTLVGILVVAGALSGNVGASTLRVPAAWKNCTVVNQRYPHGIGKVGARDHSSGTPVTDFKRSNKLYKLAISYNHGLDRDGDGIACESA